MRRLLAVLGRDVSRSRSPDLHARAAVRLGLDVAYVPVSCADEEAFDRAVQALRTLGARGANVTIPYKARALALADRASPLARAVGAANTLTFEDDGLEADNTDAPALVALLSALPAAALARPVVLGAGGAARAAVWALRAAGAPAVVVAARDPARAEVLAAWSAVEVRALAERPAGSLAVSALPNDAALAEQALAEWIDAPRVLDLAYGPPGGTSPLVAGARARGLEATDGLAMLIGQAARSLARWTGVDPSAAEAAMGEGGPGAFDSHSGRA